MPKNIPTKRVVSPTAEQQKVIATSARKFKVSANAGSGKTFTIMQRIAHIIANGSSRLDQLLVLTFTEASAKDMRKKLKEQLGDLVKPAELQAATIGTFHSFCASIVRAWFTIAEVSPSFVVMDAIESEKIKASIFEQVVLEQYAQIAKVVDLFTASSRKLDQLRDVVFELQDFLDTREDRNAWLQNTALTAYEPDVDRNPAIQALIDYYHHTAEKYRTFFLETGTLSPMLDTLVDLCNRILAAKTYAEFGRLELTVPDAKNGELKTQSDAFRKLREDFRDKVCRVIPEICKYPVAQITADIKAERAVVEQLLILVQAFDRAYQAKKAESRQLDFSDLEKYALKVLANPEALTAIRSQFKYIFVDEGQDTNPVQFKIINLLRGDDKFFCIVGDVKQSIYGFRACEPEIFESLKDEDGNLVPVLLLGKNFRSTDPILHFVNKVMQPLIPHYMDYHKFTEIGVPDPAAMKAAVVIESAKKLPAQMELVYQHIKAASPTFQWQDIVVLTEAGTHLVALQKYLSERGITAVIDRKTNALNEPEIVLLNQFLFAAMNPTNDMARYIVLQYLFKFTNDELAHLRLGRCDTALADKVAQSDAVLAKYRTLGRSASTYEVLTQVATEFGMLEMPVVNAFLTAIRSTRDFDTVARYLYLIEHELVKVEVNVGAAVQNAVRLMTIHNSKGLEFPMVILFNMGNLWSSQNNDHSNVKVVYDKKMGVCISSVDTENYVLKSPVLHLGIKKYHDELNVQEKIRLLYVALTRAKKKMVIIGDGKRNSYLVQPNSMMQLINPLGVIEHDEIELSSPQTVARSTATVTVPTCPVVGHPETLVKQSVTALATAEDPFQDYVTPVKFADAGGKAFGTAFHRQVQYGDLPEAVADLVAGYTVYREIPFLYTQDHTIVQGIMDLLAVRDHNAIIVDYKTTRLPQAQLVAKYREQLRLYAQAVPTYQVRAYIYSTVHKALIEVSF